jgi:N-acetylglucosamine kinase
VWRALLAPPLAMILNTVGASIVPVGGGLSNVPALIATLDGAVRGMILRRTDAPLVVPAKCRIEPGLIGAAAVGEAAFG